jgi:hypothetical protein
MVTQPVGYRAMRWEVFAVWPHRLMRPRGLCCLQRDLTVILTSTATVAAQVVSLYLVCKLAALERWQQRLPICGPELSLSIIPLLHYLYSSICARIQLQHMHASLGSGGGMIAWLDALQPLLDSCD